MFDAAESRIGVLCAAARVLRDDWRAAAHADSRANFDAEPHVAANCSCAASNPYTAADFYGDRCTNVFCDAKSKRDWYLNIDADRDVIAYTNP
jgi:hypothetical protein